MRNILLLSLTATLSSPVVFADEWTSMPTSLEDSFFELPTVLTATRLKQPGSEVPGSMTVITAEQIQAWGVRTIPEILRYVPGMVIGHTHYENNTQVSYHISNPNLMRRMQVLLDGRSVYKSSIAAVVWDDIPVALEDIARIEVMRGPNSATYGANAFMSTINLITKDAADTLGTRTRYRRGSQGTNDTFVSHSGLTDSSSYRLSASIKQHDGFDSSYAVKNGGWTDSKEHGFISGLYQKELTPQIELELRGSFKQGMSEVKNDFMPELNSSSTVLNSKLIFDFSDNHQSHLQVFFTDEKSSQSGRIYAPKIMINEHLYALYQSDPAGIKRLIDEDELSQLIVRLMPYYPGKDFAYIAGVLTEESKGLDDNEEEFLINGYSNIEIIEKRLDIEWQDTVVWNDSLRSVTGFNFRQDWIESEHFFNGYNKNSMYRFFGNMEWRMTNSLIWNIGAMYEVEDKNDWAFSPRFALNWLLSDHQSIRFVKSKAVRSPDLLEQEADHGVIIRDIRDAQGNLLAEYEGKSVRGYQHRIAKGDLDHEKITSYEIGYYGHFPRAGLSVDIKLYQDYLTNLISAPVNYETTDITSDVEIDVRGIDLHINWQWNHNNFLWLAWAYNENSVDPGSYHLYSSRDPVVVIVEGERRASAKNTYVASWHHTGNSWSSTMSYFLYDQYNNGETEYDRFEWNVRKDIALRGSKLWLGFWWQHIMGSAADGDTPYLSREYHRYESRNLYFVQAGLNF